MQIKHKYLFLSAFILIMGIVPVYAKKTDKKGKDSKQSQVVSSVNLSENDRRKFDYYYYEAINAKVLAEYNTFYDYLDYCFQLDSTNSAVLFELGNFYNSLEQKDKALDFYRNAVKYDRKNFTYKTSLASSYLELQQYTEAIDIYEELVSENPDKADLYLYLAESYRADGNFLKSIETLDRVEKIVGLNEKLSMQKFQLYSALDNKKRAYAEFEKYIEKYPRDIKYYVLLGNIYMGDNKMQEAQVILSKAKAIDPDDPYLIAAMAGYYEKMNQKQDAERELNIALLSPKLDIDTKLNILGQYIGTLQLNNGDTQRANALLDTLIVEHPQEPKLNFMYGNLLMLQKKNDEAIFHFRVFAESNPSNPVGWEQLLRAIPSDSTDLSIKICKEAISYNPDEILFYYYLGIGQYQKKENNEALDTFKTGVSKADKDDSPALVSEFYGMIGSLFYEEKQSDSAFVAFQKALSYNPNNLGVLNNYSYYLSLEKKDLNKAESMSKITITAEPTNPTFLDTYGWILFEQGDYVSSRIYLQNAVRYSEEKESEVSAEVLEHYGDVLFKLGEETEALEYWKKAKEKKEEPSEVLDKKIETGTYVTE